jgi:DNA-directed RNA polymerase subunit RPC12/RpoP
MTTIPHVSEKYRCGNCHRYFLLEEVQSEWVCPICKSLIQIKINIGRDSYECNRVHPDALNVNDQVVHDVIYTIINISEKENDYSIALKGYGVHHLNRQDYILLINGGWYE